jgi:hypothetical protein
MFLDGAALVLSFIQSGVSIRHRVRRDARMGVSTDTARWHKSKAGWLAAITGTLTFILGAVLWPLI